MIRSSLHSLQPYHTNGLQLRVVWIISAHHWFAECLVSPGQCVVIQGTLLRSCRMAIVTACTMHGRYLAVLFDFLSSLLCSHCQHRRPASWADPVLPFLLGLGHPACSSGAHHNRRSPSQVSLFPSLTTVAFHPDDYGDLSPLISLSSPTSSLTQPLVFIVSD